MVQKWRDHSYALDLRGRPRKFGTPSPQIRMLHAIGVCIAMLVVKGSPPWLSPCSLNRTIPKQIS